MPRLKSAHSVRLMTSQIPWGRWRAVVAGISSSLVAVRSMVRRLPLLLSASPQTPLRVLCIMAFDMLHTLRHAKPLPMHKVRTLAALLDFGACTNAAFDNKKYCRQESRRLLQLLEGAGIRSSVTEYLRKLTELERGRPLPGGEDGQFQTVVLYREAVVGLSLGMVAATALGNLRLADAIRAISRDADLNILFRIVMQCQIIDDVLDYARDVLAGLPSFLTAGDSLSQAFERTRLAALGYADDRNVSRAGELFPLRAALFLLSAGVRLAIALAVGNPRHSTKASRYRAAIRRRAAIVVPLDLGRESRENCEHHSPRGALAQRQSVIHRGKQVDVRAPGAEDELKGVLAARCRRSQPLHLRQKLPGA